MNWDVAWTLKNGRGGIREDISAVSAATAEEALAEAKAFILGLLEDDIEIVGMKQSKKRNEFTSPALLVPRTASGDGAD